MQVMNFETKPCILVDGCATVEFIPGISTKGEYMKKIGLWLVLLSSSSLMSYTLKTDFWRIAKKYENPQFPLDIPGHLDLSFRVTLKEAEKEGGISVQVDRRIEDEVVSSYTGFFAFGEEVWIDFPDGTKGPKMTFEDALKDEPSADPTP